MENLLGVPNHPLQVAGQHHLAAALGEDLAQRHPVAQQLLPLALNLGHHLAAAGHVPQNLVGEHAPHVALVGRVELVLAVERVVGQRHGLDGLEE